MTANRNKIDSSIAISEIAISGRGNDRKSKNMYKINRKRITIEPK
jgi:hypothetical protein